MKLIRHRFCLALATTTLLTGCSSSTNQTTEQKINELNTQMGQLQKENAALKEKLNSQPDGETTTKDDNLKENGTKEETTETSQIAKHPQFIDLEEVPNKDMIDDLTKLGLFDGMPEKFEPYKPISRGEYVIWLFKANNLLQNKDKQVRLAPQLEPQFKDLQSSDPSYKYAQALANAGYSVGYDDGSFKPNQAITREEMIGMKVGVDEGKNIAPYKGQMAFVWKFSDAQQVDNRFSGYIHNDYYISGPNGNNIQRAFGKIGTFKPKQAVSRQEAAGTLWQVGTHGYNGGTASKEKDKVAN
jgi:outer membrane murein-binding lipoprotein Lpp